MTPLVLILLWAVVVLALRDDAPSGGCGPARGPSFDVLYGGSPTDPPTPQRRPAGAARDAKTGRFVKVSRGLTSKP